MGAAMEPITIIAGGIIAIAGTIFTFAMGIASARLDAQRERDAGHGAASGA